MTETAALTRAFQLAHSIYRFRQEDRKIALRVLSEALNGVQVRLIAQHEADRHAPQKPSKVRWNTEQWLQLLIYYKSEAYEREQEKTPSSLSQEDMIIRYIKHLILITSRRNSFYISLGLCRLLYDYNAAETIAIYDLVFQDPDSSTKKVDAYYRGVKTKLLEELAHRFAGLIKIVKGMRGEKSFQSERPSEPLSQLVVDYLTRFTPWSTSCKLPTRADDWSIIQALQSSQTSQIHSLIHPACFSIITRLLNVELPERRLRAPTFFLEGGSEGATPPDGGASELSQEEAGTIRKDLADLEQRRKRLAPSELRVLADGTECARLNLAESNSLRFEIDENTTLIEIVGHDGHGDLLLGTYLRFSDSEEAAGQLIAHSIRLEGGQQITLTIRESAENGESTLAVEIKYEKRRSWVPQLAPATGAKPFRWDSWRIPIAAGALLLIIGMALMFYFRFANSSRSPKELIAQVQPTPATVTVPPPTGSRTPEIPTTTSSPHLPTRKSATPESLTRPGNTREMGVKADRSLLDIERLYVTATRGDVFTQNISRRISEGLGALNRFAMTANKDDADAALIISARGKSKRNQESAGQEVEAGTASFQIVNISGEVIWRSSVFRGSAEDIAGKFTDELRKAMEKLRHGQD